MNHSKRNDWNWMNKICSTGLNYKIQFKTKWLKSNRNILKTNLYSTVIIDCVWLSWKTRKTKIEKRFSQIQQQKHFATMSSLNVNLRWLQQKQRMRIWWTKRIMSLNTSMSSNYQWKKTLQFNQNKMTETKDKIINEWLSIEKDRLFAMSKSDWKLARVEMMMILHRTLHVSILEAHQKTQQLKPEREAFYSLIN